MRGIVEDIQVLFNNPAPTTFYLEKDSIGFFIQWLQADPQHVLLLGAQWHVVVFRNQIVQYQDYLNRRKKLKQLNVEVNDHNPGVQDGLFIEEVERTYFSTSGANQRQLAEFYVMVRRSAGNGWVNIISQDRSFERIPMVNTYFVGTEPRTGSQDLPAQFDFLRDFGIHPSLARSISNRLDDLNRGDVILNATLTLRDHIRILSGLTEDNRPLVERAFKQDGINLRINPLVHAPDPHYQSQQDEQHGFREMYCGFFTGVRNPIVHEGPGSIFSQSRYPDKMTLLKYLSLLSVLFERADGPLP